MRKLFAIFSLALHQFVRHDGLVSSGHLAFLSMLGLFPFLIFVISLAAFAGQTQAGIQTIHFILSQLPTDVQSVLHKPVNSLLHDTSKRILLTSIAGAIWASSSSMNAARDAIRRAYDLRETPPFWRRHLESLALVILSGLAVMAGMAILVLGPVALKTLNMVIPLNHAWLVFSRSASVIVGLVFMFPAIYGAYFTLGPTGHRRITPHLPGTVTTILLWTAVGGAFSNYLKYLGHYSNTYGSLAGPIIALLFFYVINAAFLFGAEVNSAVMKISRDQQGAASTDKNV